MKSVLLVDDEPLITESISLYIEMLGHRVTTKNSGNSAVAQLKTDTFDLIICDYLMPDGNGIEVLNFMKGLKLRPLFIYYSAHVDLITLNDKDVMVIPKPNVKGLFSLINSLL